MREYSSVFSIHSLEPSEPKEPDCLVPGISIGSNRSPTAVTVGVSNTSVRANVTEFLLLFLGIIGVPSAVIIGASKKSTSVGPPSEPTVIVLK